MPFVSILGHTRQKRRRRMAITNYRQQKRRKVKYLKEREVALLERCRDLTGQRLTTGVFPQLWYTGIYLHACVIAGYRLSDLCIRDPTEDKTHWFQVCAHCSSSKREAHQPWCC